MSGSLQKGRRRANFLCTVPANQMVSREELESFFGLLRDWIIRDDFEKSVVVTSGAFAGSGIDSFRRNPSGAVAVELTRESKAGSERDELRSSLDLMLGDQSELSPSDLERLIAQLFTSLGYRLLVTLGPTGLTGFVQKDGRRTIFECAMVPGRKVSRRDVEQWLLILVEGSAAEGLEENFTVMGGPLAGSTMAFGARKPLPADLRIASETGTQRQASRKPVPGQVRGGEPPLAPGEMARHVVDLLTPRGFRLALSHGPDRVAGLIEKDGRRAVIDCAFPHGRVSLGDLETFLDRLQEGYEQGGVDQALTIAAGSLAGSTVELSQATAWEPISLNTLEMRLRTRERSSTLDLLRSAPGGDSRETLVRKGSGTSLVLGLGGVLFPSRSERGGPAADFFRRYGTLCLLVSQDPYPVPLSETRTYLAEKGLVRAGQPGILRLLVPRRFGANVGAEIQEWLDESPDAAAARRRAVSAMRQSATLDEYIKKLRDHLSRPQPPG